MIAVDIVVYNFSNLRTCFEQENIENRQKGACSMRFFHLSDLHIGKHLHMYNLAQDQKYIFRQIVEKVIEYRPDAIVIAGDIYDKSVPSGEAYQLFDSFLNSLADIKPSIPVLVIAGNHDSQERLQYASSFLERHQIYIATKPPQEETEHLKKVTLTDSYGEVDFYLFPFMKPGYVRHLFPQEESLSYESAFEFMLQREAIDWKRRNVLVAHQFFINQGKKPECCDSEQLSLNVGGVDSIDIRVVRDFDYVAAGHIHGPQTFECGKVRYCGTPLKYSVSEEKHQKSITMVTLEEQGKEPIIEIIPLQALHDVRRLRGKLDELLQAEDVNREDYMSITLTDEKELYRPKDVLSEVYPHILEINVDNSRIRGIYAGLQGEGLEEDEGMDKLQSPLEAFREFYQMMQQQPLSESEERVIIEILDEVGGDLS